jgi:hypothetical protein
MTEERTASDNQTAAVAKNCSMSENSFQKVNRDPHKKTRLAAGIVEGRRLRRGMGARQESSARRGRL